MLNAYGRCGSCGWHLCDPIWHVISRSGEVITTAILRFYRLPHRVTDPASAAFDRIEHIHLMGLGLGWRSNLNYDIKTSVPSHHSTQ